MDTRKQFAIKDFLSISVFWFALEFCWQGLITIIFPDQIVTYVDPASKGRFLGLIMAVGAIISMLGQPIAGTFSDYSDSRFGRRKPFFVSGFLLFIISLFMLLFSNSFLLFFISVVFIFLASDLSQAPYQGLIPDLVPKNQKGKASGFMSTASILGAILGPISAGYFIGINRFSLSIYIIIATLTVTGLYTIVAVKEERIHLKYKLNAIEKIKQSFNFGFKVHKNYFILQLARFFLMLSLTMLLVFFFFFVKDVIKAVNVAQTTGVVMGIASFIALSVSLPAAHFSDKFGRKPLLYFGGALGIIANIILIFTTTLLHLFITILFFGLAFGIYYSILWAFLIDYVPLEESGKYLGYSQYSTSFAQVFAPIIGGFIIDAYSGSRFGYQLIYSISLIFTLSGMYFIHLVKEET
ncbi:MAG: MFS transporter [Actinomycetia bacterium]|nr:MFS transporter [Actinomycetes bacterium]